jgi:polyphosphate glucokinase
MKQILVVDVGGSSVKVALGSDQPPIKIESGPTMSAAAMVAAVKKATANLRYDAVSIGFPGAVKDGRPAAEPRNLGRGWVRFDYEKGFGKPVKIVNDAAMQALGSYHGGRMLFLGLGTGLGSALVAEGVLMPLELAHLPYRKGRTYEDYVGAKGRKRLGKKRWAHHVAQVVELLRHGLQADYVVLGGGEADELKKLPSGAELGSNQNAIRGGLRLWSEPAPAQRRARREAVHSLDTGSA